MVGTMKKFEGQDAAMVEALENAPPMAGSGENDVSMVDAEKNTTDVKKDTTDAKKNTTSITEAEKIAFQKCMIAKLSELKNLLPQRERQGLPLSDPTKVSPPIRLLLYFDEAQSLVGIEVGDSTYYHVLLRCINSWCTDHPEVIVVFLSTNGKLSDLAPPSKYVTSWRYGRYHDTLQPPIVETPFDCSPHFPLRPGLMLQDVSSLRHIAQFGRPL